MRIPIPIFYTSASNLLSYLKSNISLLIWMRILKLWNMVSNINIEGILLLQAHDDDIIDKEELLLTLELWKLEWPDHIISLHRPFKLAKFGLLLPKSITTEIPYTVIKWSTAHNQSQIQYWPSHQKSNLTLLLMFRSAVQYFKFVIFELYLSKWAKKIWQKKQEIFVLGVSRQPSVRMEYS